MRIIGILKYILIIVGIAFGILFVMTISYKYGLLRRIILYDVPMDGNYYFWVESDVEDNVVIHAQYRKGIYEEAIDLQNIIIKYKTSNLCIIDKNDLLDDNKIRLRILEEGIGTIKDERFASEDEIKAQERAKEAKNGYWEKLDADTEIVGKGDIHSVHEIVGIIDTFITDTSLIDIIRWVLLSFIGLGSISMAIYRIIMRKKVFLVFFGEPASGKTTMCKRLLRPYADLESIKAQTIPTTLREIIKCKSIKVGQHELIPCMVDNPGSQTGKMLDDLVKYKYVKAVPIIILPYYKDRQKLLQETSKAVVIARTIKQSKRFKNIKKIILFINKADQYFDNSSLFWKNKERIYHVFEDDDFKELKSLVTVIDCGSALAGWNLEDMIEKAVI